MSKGQMLHSDVNQPEDFGLGAFNEAPLPRVFKEEVVARRSTRSELLRTTRSRLGLNELVGLSPGLGLQGPEEMRYFGARLLTAGKDILEAGIRRPWVTTDIDAPFRAWDADAKVSDVALSPGGTP